MGISKELLGLNTTFAVLASASLFGAFDLAVGQHEIDMKVYHAQEEHRIFPQGEDPDILKKQLQKDFEGRGLRDIIIATGSLLALRAVLFEFGDPVTSFQKDYEESYE